MKTIQILFSSLFILGSIAIASAQNVGINTTGAPGNPSAMLDVEATDKGVLIPRVALTARNNNAPVGAAIVTSLLVYNTATAGTGTNAVSPGYYYWNGTLWMRVATDGDYWRVDGNAGTTAGTNFLGTTDAQGIDLRTNNLNRIRIQSDNVTQTRVGIGTIFPTSYPAAAPNTPTLLHLFDAGTTANDFSQLQLGANKTTANSKVGELNFQSTVDGPDRRTASIESFVTAIPTTNNQTGDLRFNTNNAGVFSEKMRILGNGGVRVNTAALLADYRFVTLGLLNEIAVTGISTGNGIGVYGFNNNNGIGVFGYNENNNGVAGDFWNNSAGGLGVYVEGGAASGRGLLSYGANGMAGVSTLATGTGVFGVGNGGAVVNILPEGSGMASTGFHGLYANSNTALGTGLVATGNNLGVYSLHPSGSGIAATGSIVGVYGIANNTTGDRAGGIFQVNSSPGGGLTPDVRVAARVGGTFYKIIGWGGVSTIVRDTEEKDVIMFAPEAPEVLFQDYGIGELQNGKAIINLDPIVSKNINVSEDKPLKVFIQLEGECNGVYVTNKSKDGFEVVELNGGQSNVPFSWSIVATRANQIIGNEESDFSVRFPKVPDYEPSIQGESERNSLERKERNNDFKKEIENIIND